MLAVTEWDGKTGEAWAEEWRRTDRTLAPLNQILLAHALPFEGRRILDVGCGAGATSLALAAALPDAEITGLDVSAALATAARARVDGRANVRFVTGDASAWSPEDGRTFDLIVSRHGVMFFDDAVATFRHLRGLAPRGRLLFSCFRAASENEWMTAMQGVIRSHAPEAAAPPPGAPGPFAFADPAHVESILRAAGFATPVIRPFDFAFVAGAGDDPVADALAYFRRIGPMARVLAALDSEAAKAAFLADLEAAAATRLQDGAVVFGAAAWIVSCQA